MTTTASTPAADQHFPCPKCGADLRFLPGKRHLSCDHCGAQADIRAQGPWDRHYNKHPLEDGLARMAATVDLEETGVASCSSCSAEILWVDELRAMECPFCASPIVAGLQRDRHIKPQGILPFRIPKKSAQQSLVAWYDSLNLPLWGIGGPSPRGVDLVGVYVPIWIFDATAHASYVGHREGNEYAKLEGNIVRSFRDMWASASLALPGFVAWDLSPWAFALTVPYRADYLSGFLALGSSVDLADGYNEAFAATEGIMRSEAARQMNGVVDTMNLEVRNVTFKQVLVPVWVGTYRYRRKTRPVVVNGYSGKVWGEIPKPRADWVTMAVILVTGVFLTIALWG